MVRPEAGRSARWKRPVSVSPYRRPSDGKVIAAPTDTETTTHRSVSCPDAASSMVNLYHAIRADLLRRLGHQTRQRLPTAQQSTAPTTLPKTEFKAKRIKDMRSAISTS